MSGSIVSGNRFGIRRRTVLQAGAAIVLPTAARAQESFPDKPVWIVASQMPRKAGPEALAQFHAGELAKWGSLAKATGTWG